MRMLVDSDNVTPPVFVDTDGGYGDLPHAYDGYVVYDDDDVVVDSR